MNKINFVQNMERNMFIIKNKLLENVNLRKLLFYTGPDALESTDPTAEDVERYIDLTSVVNYGQNPNNPINNFIVVSWSNADLSDFTQSVSGIIVEVFCNHSSILLDNNKMRHFAISQEIVTSLNSSMLLSAGKMELINMELKILNETYVGFELEFMAIDSTEVEDF